eukprot:10923963-Alexandrium_andersonii.AAC.1
MMFPKHDEVQRSKNPIGAFARATKPALRISQSGPGGKLSRENRKGEAAPHLDAAKDRYSKAL